MDLSQSTALKTEQTLSANMLQSLKLLEMNRLELRNAINAKIEENPALEIPDREFNEEPPLKSAQSSKNNDSQSFSEDDADPEFYEKNLNRESFNPGATDTGYSSGDSPTDIIECTMQNTETLGSHLLKQLGLSKTDEKTAKIAEMLISNLDDKGFFILELPELFKETKYSGAEIKKALALVQTFDPAGICCKDIEESLIIQARNRGMAKSDLTTFSSIVKNYLQDLNNGKFTAVAAKLHISEEDLMSFYEILKNLTLFPGASYSKGNLENIIPEASIHVVEGEIQLDIYRSSLPSLRISNDFKEFADSPDKDTKSYAKKQLKDAENFIESIEKRYETLAKVLGLLIDKQKDFFYNGPRHLSVLTMKEIATELELAVSTISRLADSKWIETDWGLKPIKFFFSSGVKQTDTGKPNADKGNTDSSQASHPAGFSAPNTNASPASEGAASLEPDLVSGSLSADISKSSIQEIIKDIIIKYGKISDQKISDKLAERGIKCARRTVNKYRAEIGL